jgi:SAM-dependent methyltransferase
MARIYGKKVDLRPSAVHEFFERRGRSINAAHPLTSVLYQDNNPLLAEKRDAFEKQRVLPLLGLAGHNRVLDVGCGIGRWADALVGKAASYRGIDFSESLIAAAQERLREPGFEFQVLAAQELQLSKLNMPERFSNVLVCGVMMYLNDADVRQTLSAIATCCAESARIYVREPVALQERLTLDNFTSSELGSTYSAIYRTEDEILSLFDGCLGASGFRIVANDFLYPAELNNRSETAQRIFLLEHR